MHDPEMNSLMKAATERQLAVAALQKKYQASESVPTEQLVLDMRPPCLDQSFCLICAMTIDYEFAVNGFNDGKVVDKAFRHPRSLPAALSPCRPATVIS